MTSVQLAKIRDVTISALTAAGITGLMAYQAGKSIKWCLVGAALSLLKDLHSFTSTAPKDLPTPMSDAGGDSQP